MQIIIPMAGNGHRFENSKWKTLKPLIKFNGKMMIEHVMDNVNYHKNSKFILIARKEHIDEYKKEFLKLKSIDNVLVVEIFFKTEGPLCTALFAKDYIKRSESVFIVNSDQIVDINVNTYIDSILKDKLDGSMLTFKETLGSSKWSFLKTGENGLVEEVRAKDPFTNEAVVGWYFFTKAEDFIESGIDLIISNNRANGEFFVCPIYNYAIKRGKKIGSYLIKENEMHGIGTPEDLDKYLKKIF